MSRFETNHHRLEYEYGFDPSWTTVRDAFSPPRRSMSGGLDYIDGARLRNRTRKSNGQRDRDGQSYVYIDREKESLKQRMVRPVALPSSTASSLRRHNRARSLSLSRASSSESSLSDESELDQHLMHRPLVKYYQHERLSHSSPKVPLSAWPSSRPGSRARSPDYPKIDGNRRPDRYERGYQLIEQRHHSADPGLSVSPSHEELQMRMQQMSIRPEMRAISVRSASFDTKSNASAVRRKGVSLSPGRMERMGATPNKNRSTYPRYNQVHVLILTWEFHDLKAAPYTAPPAVDYISLEDETRRLRDTLESYGYMVHEFSIPMQRSTELMRMKLKDFCRFAADDTLLMVYYHGHGSLDNDNELVFSSHEHPANPEWSQAAAAEMYAAMINGDACRVHGRADKFQQLVRKYERYRPVSEVKWDDIRPIVLGAPCDLLLILDCCAAGGANVGHVDWQPPPSAEGYTKHLFAACGFESSTSDDMTAAMCDVLDQWVPGEGIPKARTKSKSGASSPSGAPQVLTTKKLHQHMEADLQKGGSQPIFKQLLPHDPEQYITLPNFRLMEQRGAVDRRGRRRGYYVG